MFELLLTALLTTVVAMATPARCAYAVTRDPVAARVLAARAYDLYQARSYQKAAQLYRAAAEADPDDPAYGYNAARAAQLAGQLEATEAGFVATLRHGGATATMRQQAQRHLDEVRAALNAVRAARTGPADGWAPGAAAAGPTANDGATRRTVGWGLAGGAVAGVGIGAVLLALSPKTPAVARIFLARTIPA